MSCDHDFGNLCDTDLSDAYLRGADLRGARLSHARLGYADLRGAKLSNADLRNANLCGARMSDANLRGAKLRYTNLSGANLSGADLTGTCLEPETSLPPIPDAEIIDAGLEICGGYVYGWRTARSTVAGDTVYEPGRIYVAPWFSTDGHTDCHPGIYLAGQQWLHQCHPELPLVRVRCLRSDLLHCYDKWRCRALEVIS